MSIDDKKCPLNKQGKKNRFSRGFRRFFGCISKNVEGTEPKFISVSCQCQIEKELEANNVTETKEQLNHNEESPVAEEFRTSIKKLDSLIDTLNNIHDIYKSSHSLHYYNDENEAGEVEVANKELEEDVLKFNINFDKNTSIECQTKKGKHSLKIIHKSGHHNFSPLILHRCESEFLLKKRSHETLTLKASSEIFFDKTDQIPKSYNRLRGKFGAPVYNLSTFKKNLVDQLKNIKNDIKTLRNILYYVECVTSRDRRLIPLSFGEISRWFLGNSTSMRYDDDKYIRASGCRYIEAKTRATNFCRFYIMDKKSKEKRKTMPKVNKNKY